MLSESVHREIYALIDRFGTRAVLRAVRAVSTGYCDRSGELKRAVRAAERALEKVKQAGEDKRGLRPAVD